MNRLKELRERKKLTQKELANILNIPRVSYCRIENEVFQADYETLKKLSKYFNVTINYILDEKDQNLIFLTKQEFEKFKEVAKIINDIDTAIKTKTKKEQNIEIQENNGEIYIAEKMSIKK